MLTKPGDAVKYYISKERTQYISPVKFLVICSIIFAICNYFFHTDHVEHAIHNNNPFFYIEASEWLLTASILNWMKDNFAVSGLITGIFIALGIKIIFRKSGYNLLTIFILLCYIGGIMVLMLSLATIVQRFIQVNILKIFASGSILYLIWSIGMFFDKKKVLSYVKAILSYFLGATMFGILIFLIGISSDFIMKWKS